MDRPLSYTLPDPATPPLRLIPISEVTRLTGRGRSNIYASVRAGHFPAPIKDGSSSRWVFGEVIEWIRKRVADRDAKAAA